MTALMAGVANAKTSARKSSLIIAFQNPDDQAPSLPLASLFANANAPFEVVRHSLQVTDQCELLGLDGRH